MKDLFNEDYLGRWLLVCEEGGKYFAFIDKVPVSLSAALFSPKELLLSLRRLVDIEMAKAFDLAAGQPILLT